MTVWDDIAIAKGPMRAAWDNDHDDTDRHVDAIIDRMSDRPGTVLDFGCGPGRLTVPIQRRTGRFVFGVDTSHRMVEPLATHAWNHPMLGVKINDASDPTNAWARSWVDDVYSMLTFQHMTHHRVHAAMGNIAPSIRPGGRFVAQFTVGDDADRGPLSHPWPHGDAIADMMSGWFRWVAWQHDEIEPTWCWVWGER